MEEGEYGEDFVVVWWCDLLDLETLCYGVLVGYHDLLSLVRIRENVVGCDILGCVSIQPCICYILIR